MNISEFLLLGMVIIFVISGFLKIYSPATMRSTLLTLGVHKNLSRFGARFIPLIELFAAFALLWEGTRLVGEWLVLGLLCCFAIAVFLAMIQKQKVKCNCFGHLIPQDLGWSTVSHIMLILLADVYLLVGNQSSNLMELSAMEITFAILSWIGILGIYMLVYYINVFFRQSNVASPRR
ncbi:MAG: hypothetical protein JWM44_2324 [Bacilli bacterium]|nr:hypothetical protein [Bacilli bacterium]